MLRQRIVTALILAPFVILVIFWLPPLATVLVFAAPVLAGAWEWAPFSGMRQPVTRLVYVAVTALLMVAAWLVADSDQGFSVILAAALAWWLVALAWIVFSPGRSSSPAAAVAGLLVLVPAWLAVAKLQTGTAQGPQLVLFLLLLVVAADVGAYFSGRAFGRRKLAPQVSPGKTWEGVWGGMAAAGIMAIAGIAWFGMSAGPFIMLCIGVVAASVVGDLTESLFKRHAGVKDSGQLLPGHGGVLDRIDSITAAAPLFVIGLDHLDLLG